jgi:hypothetical protein
LSRQDNSRACRDQPFKAGWGIAAQGDSIKKLKENSFCAGVSGCGIMELVHTQEDFHRSFVAGK